MTGRTRTPLDRPDPLTLAIEAYGARFPRHGLPFLRPAGSLEGREAAIRLLRRAVATGRPLSDRTVVDASGSHRPPEGTC